MSLEAAEPSAPAVRWAAGCCLPAAGNVFWAQSFPLPSAHIPAKCSVHSNVQNVSCAPRRWKMHYRAIRRGIWNFILFSPLEPSALLSLCRRVLNGPLIPKLADTLNPQTVFIFPFKLCEAKWAMGRFSRNPSRKASVQRCGSSRAPSSAASLVLCTFLPGAFSAFIRWDAGMICVISCPTVLPLCDAWALGWHLPCCFSAGEMSSICEGMCERICTWLCWHFGLFSVYPHTFDPVWPSSLLISH